MMEENESNFQVEERKIDREEAGSPQHLWESAVGSVVHGAATVKQKATDIKAKTQHAAATVAVKAKEQLSVFGAAPSLATMKSLNQLGKGNKNMFVCAEFWYKFRLYYPIFAPLSFIIGLIFATTLWNTENGHMLIAALLSFLSCVSVCASYIMILPWRRHPSTIVFYRAGVNMFFSFLVICMAIAYNSNPDEKCNGYAVSVEFALISGECWLTTIALDLVLSLTNPFTSYKGNMKRYHSITWVFAIILSFALYNQPACQKRFESGFCWVSDTSCFIGYYVFWIVAMYIYQFGAIIFAFLRLRKGLPTTFQVRSKIATETFKCLAVYGCYLFFMCILLIVLGSRPESSDHSTNWNNFRKVFLFFVCSRGFVDGVVWFMQHEFAADEKPIKIQKVPTNDIQEDDEENVVRNVILEESGEKFDSNNFDAEFDKNMERRVQMRRRTSSFSSINSPERRRSKIHDVADAIAEVVEITAGNQGFDESDLSPQVNLALRQQIVKFVTMGVTLSARKDYTLGTVMTNPIEKAINQAIDYVKELIIPKDPRLENLQVIEFLLLDEHPFKEFAHDIFRDIRAAEGIDEDYYLAALQKTEREQLSEGASGAFMFFCGGGDFLVKTINANEADVLHRSLEIYRDYLRENPDSLLVRFLGSYSLKVYAQTFHFVVMRNIFEPGTDVNERFDIKGSWVNRSAAPPMPNKRVVCRHCNEMFTPAAQEMCSKIIGKHEANVVLKDNDLRVKISLRSQDACTILDIIKKDSDLLAELGVLDYSLIIGIKKRNFDIIHDPEKEKANRPNSKHKNSKKKYVAYNAKSVSGAAIYYMGIVDFLQDWSLRKKIERATKIYLTRNDPAGISVMEPYPYRDRFQDKMDKIFDIQGEDLDGSAYRVSYAERPSSATFHPVDHHEDVAHAASDNIPNIRPAFTSPPPKSIAPPPSPSDNILFRGVDPEIGTPIQSSHHINSIDVGHEFVDSHSTPGKWKDAAMNHMELGQNEDSEF